VQQRGPPPVAESHAHRDDVYELAYCYDAAASTADVFGRSVAPLVAKLLDGFNVNVIVLGATGSGKAALLEGTLGVDAESAGAGDGLVHAALTHLFDGLRRSSVKARV